MSALGNENRETSPARAGRSRAARVVAAGVVAGLAVGVGTSFGSADAATVATGDSSIQAQSVGNFLDATVGGMTLDQVAALKYAKAVAPGSNGVQNPLDVTLFNQATIPLTGSLQIPSISGTTLGAANQVAKANVNGAAYGASGAVSNSGGISSGGENNAYPATGTLKLDGSAFSSMVPIPGAPDASALGGVSAKIGAVSGIASTPEGYGKAGSTDYNIADVSIVAESPALAALLGQIDTALNGVIDQLAAAGGTTGVPKECTFDGNIGELSLDDGAVTLSAETGSLSVSLSQLLKTLGVDLNNLPANTDLLDYLLAYITSAKGLSAGLMSAFNGITSGLQKNFDNCLDALTGNTALGPLASLLQTVIGQLNAGQGQIESAINTVVTALTAAGGDNPLAPLATGLQQLLDIGVNVQPNGKAGTYTDGLKATPKQGTPVVAGQTIVRAIEVNVAPAAGSGLPSGGIPGLSSLPGVGSSLPSSFGFAAPHAAPRAAAASQGILTVALGNAAAGPSTAPAATSASASPTTAVPTNSSGAIPTGVPAGAGDKGGLPTLPLVLILLTVGLAAGGVVTYRVRGTRGRRT